MSTQLSDLPVAVIGAGPVGLAAAAHLVERGIGFVVLEAGQHPGATIADWAHVRLFSPWRYNIDHAGRRLLTGTGWAEPDPHHLPTGAELITRYLAPLAAHTAIGPSVRYGARVSAISRSGYDRVRTRGREAAPFVVRLDTKEEIHAAAVIDASGTWTTPNSLGANGLAAHGEAQANGSVVGALPDVLGADRDRFAGRHTVVVGAGHSATTTLLGLAALADHAPGTVLSWAIRAELATRAYGGGDADALPARGAIGARVRELVEAGRISLVTGFLTHTVTTRPAQHGIELVSRDPNGNRQRVRADVVVNATGFRPDHTIAAELRLDLDPILGSTRALAPLIDPNEHSCGTVPPHGVDELAHPEPGYYSVGVKSYGRAPTFLQATGYEQARSVVAALAGDWIAARDVQLQLPETGVCTVTLPQPGTGAPAADVWGGGCCGEEPAPVGVRSASRGLASGVRAGLLTPAAPTGTSSGGCCGS